MNSFANKLVVFFINFLQAYVVFGVSMGLGVSLCSNVIEGIGIYLQTGAISGLIVGIGACFGVKLKYNIRFGLFLTVCCLIVLTAKYGLKSGCVYGLMSAVTFYTSLLLVKIGSIIRA